MHSPNNFSCLSFKLDISLFSNIYIDIPFLTSLDFFHTLAAVLLDLQLTPSPSPRCSHLLAPTPAGVAG